MGLIAIEGMHFYAHHGFYQEEQVIGGNYRVDVYLTADVAAAASEDNLDKTIDYEQVYQLTKSIMMEKSKLIEHVAQRIMDQVLLQLPAVQQVEVCVSKINPPVKGTVDRVFVKLTKAR